jgi:hypothetical protein
MMEQVGMGAADLRGDGLERNGLRPLLEEKQPRRFECGGAAFFGAKAFPSY